MNIAPATDESLGRYRPFVLFWFARASASFALQMLVVAVGWQVYDMTGRALDLGLVGLAQFVPAFLLVLVAGAVADRYDRSKVVRLAQMTEGAAALVLAIGSWQGFLTRDLILALVFVLGAGRAFEAPTLQALLPRLVPLPVLPRAVAGSASANQAATIAGPAAGGLLYVLSPTLVYSLCAVLFFGASILVALIRIEQVAPKREKVDLSTLFAGITFIRNNPLILGSTSLDMFAVLFAGATALMPVYAKDIFHVGPWGLGVMRAMPALGALLMAVALARWPLVRNAGRKMYLAVALFGVATIVFALSSSFPLSLFALFALGAGDMVSVVVRQTLVQVQTPDDMLGRVISVNALFVGTSNQLGEFRAGVFAHFAGTVPAVVFGGVATLLIVAAWTKLFPDLLNVQSLQKEPR
ncbi:MFS transporter [Pseudorhodoplanes sp.]|uniref:MFS transporter n=1 Tax=Pseudorhodoplanes sp. TaxID=1934341 RepID=UPI002CD857BE|nr:MFS transporter [Pseudorhodoplanes sp.]HWV53009.1 MFS transporter [Pseudorhodoplanes sp.]